MAGLAKSPDVRGGAGDRSKLRRELKPVARFSVRRSRVRISESPRRMLLHTGVQSGMLVLRWLASGPKRPHGPVRIAAKTTAQPGLCVRTLSPPAEGAARASPDSSGLVVGFGGRVGPSDRLGGFDLWFGVGMGCKFWVELARTVSRCREGLQSVRHEPSIGFNEAPGAGGGPGRCERCRPLPACSRPRCSRVESVRKLECCVSIEDESPRRSQSADYLEASLARSVSGKMASAAGQQPEE